LKKSQKVEVVQQLQTALGDAPAAVVVEYKGITVASLHTLRNQLRERGAALKVVKNTLLLRAVEGTTNECLKDFAGGPIAVAYSGPDGDAAGLAKEIKAFGMKESLLIVRGGVLTGKPLDAAGVDELATLPSIDEMRAKALSVFNAPATKFVNLLIAAPRSFLGVLNAKIEKDESATN
jgi:large subunit ribosomal protein L10